jgi:hypothetical protein
MDVDTGADGLVPEVPMVLIDNSSDVGWKYGKYCDPLNKSKVKCDFCGHISTGDIYRFKKHIVGVKNVVSSCKKATPKAKEACKKALEKVTATKGIKRQHKQDLRDDVHISSSVGEGVSTSEPNKVGPISGGSRILAKCMLQQNFGVCINNDFVLEEIMSMKYNKITK